MDCFMTNVVLKTQLLTSNPPIALTRLTRSLIDMIYNPSNFSVVVWKHRTIGGCCLLFSDGKMIVNGFESVTLGKRAARLYARLVQRKIGDGVLTPIVVVTMTLMADLKQKLCLESLAELLEGQYEPELFNAMLLKKGKIHFSIFQSGKIVIAGVKSEKIIDAIVWPALMDIVMSG